MLVPLAAFVLALFGAEAALRIMGFQPWVLKPATVSVVPAGNYYERDPLLGYRLRAGQFRVRLGDGYLFTTTHNAAGLRITSPLAEKVSTSRESIWIFGCSFTHGWSLNDEETYPWLLQRRLGHYEILNFGVDGYGTLQSLLQFEEALKQRNPKPKVVVLAYSVYHDIRNMLLRERQRGLIETQNLGQILQPYAWLDSKRQIKIAAAPRDFAPPFLLTHSTLLNFLDELYAEYERVHTDKESLGRALLLQFRDVARANNVRLVLANIGPRSIREFAVANGIDYVDIGVPPDDPQWQNLPHDTHPNARANQVYANRLGDYLAMSVFRD